MLINVQMTRMAEERNSILRVRAEVDSYDEREESQGVEPALSDNLPDSCVSLCAPQKYVRVWNISVGLSPSEFGFSNFTSRLAKFLHTYGGTKVSLQRLENCSVCRVSILCSTNSLILWP